MTAEYVVVDPAAVLRALKDKGMGELGRTTVLAVLHEQGVPAQEERQGPWIQGLWDFPPRGRFVTDWREDPA